MTTNWNIATPLMTSDDEANGKLVARGVVFDGDDTLWKTEELYDEARADAARIVAAQGLDAIAWENLERRIDVENVATMGFSRMRFPTSCVQAYLATCREAGCESDPAVEEQIRKAASTVFDRKPTLHPSARQMLSRLRAKGIRRALLTKGDREIQERRIQQSGLVDLFDFISIVEDKTPDSVRKVVDALGTEPNSTWMVGNSERSDILPALLAGLRAIHVDAHVWEHERSTSSLDDDRIRRATSLADVANWLVP